MRLEDSHESKVMAALWRWLPVILWSVIIFIMSTKDFSADKTGRIIEPLLQRIFPHATIAMIRYLHGLVRKSAHFTEYAVLFWLLVRGPMKGSPVHAIAFCGVYAALDEAHQLFVPTRGPSFYDVTLDLSGALFIHLLRASLMWV